MEWYLIPVTLDVLHLYENVFLTYLIQPIVSTSPTFYRGKQERVEWGTCLELRGVLYEKKSTLELLVIEYLLTLSYPTSHNNLGSIDIPCPVDGKSNTCTIYEWVSDSSVSMHHGCLQ